MISKVEIVDNKNTTKHYLPEIFDNGMTFNFKPGVNIIIGKNGSGKTTLVDLISQYTQCKESMSSRIPPMIKLNNFFNEDHSVKDGVKIHCDWGGKVFKYTFKDEINKMDSDTIARDINNVVLLTSPTSTGESVIEGLSILFKQLFNGETHQFPMQELIQIYKNSDGVVKEELGNLIKYYQSTQLQISPKDFEYTILMDEPDRNLDIYNIKHLYNILSYHKERTQIIAVIHNPMLIYKLSKIKDVNIIELNKHYLKEIIKFIEK